MGGAKEGRRRLIADVSSLASLGGDLALEDAKFQAYLEANGWQGDVGLHDGVGLVANEKGESVEKASL